MKYRNKKRFNCSYIYLFVFCNGARFAHLCKPTSPNLGMEPVLL